MPSVLPSLSLVWTVFFAVPRRDMAGYGGIWRDTGRYREIPGDTEEIRDTGRYGQIRADTGRCEEMQGDTGRYGQILQRYIKIPQKNRPDSRLAGYRALGPLAAGGDSGLGRKEAPQSLSLIHISEPTRPY